MSLVTLSTVKGSPGGTTVALLLALHFAAASPGKPCVLAECDVAGGDLAPRLGLSSVPGMSSLALVARRGLDAGALLDHGQPLPAFPNFRVLLGVAGPEQGLALAWILEELARKAPEIGVQVVADLGRSYTGPPEFVCLRQAADANVLVTTDGVAALLHAKAAAEGDRRLGAPARIVVAGERVRTVRDVEEATGAEVLGSVRFDAEAVELLVESARRRRGPLRGRPHARALQADIRSIAVQLSGLMAGARPGTGTIVAAS